MLSVPTDLNSVYVPIIVSKCTGEFKLDSTYPNHLNGIISQDEFQQSIKRIHHKLSKNEILILLRFLFGFSIIIGVILLILASLVTMNFMKVSIPVLHFSGAILTFFGFVLSGLTYIIGFFQRERRMQEAIARESKKYSTKLPIPCHWRFEAVVNSLIRYGNEHNISPGYYLVIDIGHSTSARSGVYYSNQVANESTLLLQEQESDASPPYYILSS